MAVPVEGTKLLQKDWVTDALIAKPIKQVLIKELPAVKELCAARSLQVCGWAAVQGPTFETLLPSCA